jgi:hypothetical protein
MKNDNVTELHRLESKFKVLDCGTSLYAMTHFEQHGKNQTSNGLDITTLDKADIKHKEMERVHRGTGRARSTSLEEILIMYVKGKMPFTADNRDGALPGFDTNLISHLWLTFQVPRIICPNRHTYGFDSI